MAEVGDLWRGRYEVDAVLGGLKVLIMFIRPMFSVEILVQCAVMVSLVRLSAEAQRRPDGSGGL